MEHTKKLLSISVSNLVASPFNVRRHSVGQVEELAALIDSQGLLHNLVVTEQTVGRGNARKVQFAVAAGERRRRALLLLQQGGRLAKSHEVLCELVPPERAREISIAENSGREALHPADEFEAFNALIAEGKGVQDVAARFGVSALTVQRRLKLAAVSPKLLALYRKDGINLDQLMALAVTDDHAAQEGAWFEAQHWDRTPATLRRRLTAGEIEAAGNTLVRFVGVDAYEAAGGIVRRDLFDDDQGRYLSDADLLRRLAADKLEGLAGEVRAEGCWAWVEARLELDSQGLRQFTPCEQTLRAANAQERAEIAKLDARVAELDRQLDAMVAACEWPAEETECINLEVEDIAALRKAIREGMRVWTPEVMAHAGTIVTVNREGDPEIIRGLVREADRKAQAASLARLHRTERASSQSDASRTTSESEALAAPEPHKAEHSEALKRRLSAHRTAALQVMLSRNSVVALAALAHVFLLRVFGDERAQARTALQVTPSLPAYAMLAAADDLKGNAAWKALDAAKESWRARLPDHPSTWLGWLIGLSQAEVIDLLTLCTAFSLSAMESHDAKRNADDLAEAVGLDMADWWEPTVEGYLTHVSKAQIVQALKEAGAGLADDGVGDMKKDVRVVKAASRLAGKRWLPMSLRPRKVL